MKKLEEALEEALEKALKIVDDVLARFQGTRQDHLMILQAFELIKSKVKIVEAKDDADTEC